MRKKVLGLFAVMLTLSLAAVIQFPQEPRGNISLCDRFLMSELNKDALILDICSDTRTTVNIMSVSDPVLSGSKITGIMYYPYNKTNQNAAHPKGKIITEWTRINNTTVLITQPIEIYPSEHSNILVIVLEKNKSTTPIQGNYVLLLGVLVCSITAMLVVRKWIK